MKKRISVFLFILSMMVCMLGSVSVYAAEIDYTKAKFTSVATQSIGLAKDSNGKLVEGTVIANFNIDSISVDDYCVYGVSNEKYNGTIYYYVCADSSFNITYTDTYFYVGFDSIKHSPILMHLGLKKLFLVQVFFVKQ